MRWRNLHGVKGCLDWVSAAHGVLVVDESKVVTNNLFGMCSLIIKANVFGQFKSRWRFVRFSA